MGTFHQGKGELHGITVVVDTTGPYVFIGRCDEMDDREVVLNDVTSHKDGHGGRTKDEFVQQSAKFGFWKTHDRVVLPRAEVASVRRLGDVPVD